MIKSLFSILNIKEKIKLIYVAIGIGINSFVELLSVGILLPLVSVLLSDDYSYFGETIENYLNLYDRNFIISFACVVVISVFIFKNLYLFFYNYFLSRFSRNIQQRVSVGLFEKYIYEKYDLLINRNTGTLMRNINAAGIIGLSLLSYLTLVVEIIIIFVLIIFLLKINFFITSTVSIIFLITGIIIFSFTKKKLFIYNKLKEKYRSYLNQHTIQSFGLIKIIKIFNKEKLISNFFKKPNYEMLNIEFKNDVMLQIPKLLIETVSVSSICFIIIFMIFGGSSIVEIIPIVTVYGAVAIRLMPSVTRIISSLQRLKTFSPLVTIVYDESKNSYNKKNQEIEKKIDNNFTFNNVRFKNVKFGFEEKNLILDNINLEIKKNEIIGIYGDSGSGKTTFANLIAGLIYPTSGEIIYNDKIRYDKKNKLSPNIGYVPQLTNLFNDTIWNNITFYEKKKDHLSLKNFDFAIKNSNLIKFIETLPEKENTKVGEGLSKISGGQAQRIGIARALFIKSEFMIFDEATSSLDVDNEKNIIDTIYSLKNKKTIIIVSHKKELLNKCDKIYQIKSKKIYHSSL